jgi:hypothetical protein
MARSAGGDWKRTGGPAKLNSARINLRVTIALDYQPVYVECILLVRGWEDWMSQG